MSVTVRDLIAEIARELRAGDVAPVRARSLSVELSALLGNVNVELLDAEMAYRTRLLSAYQAEEKANRAEMVAQTSDEYRRFLQAKLTLHQVKTMRSTLAQVLRSQEIEMRHL